MKYYFWLSILQFVLMQDAIQKIKDIIESEGIWSRKVSFSRNDFIKRAHTIDTNLYFINSGSIRVYTIVDQEERCLYFGYKNSLISSIDSFLNEEASPHFIQAIKKSEVSIINKTTFMNFIKSNKENLDLWQEILIQLLQYQLAREKELFASSSKKRYELLLKRRPQIFQEIPHKYIASYLRMSAETLSRIKKS